MSLRIGALIVAATLLQALPAWSQETSQPLLNDFHTDGCSWAPDGSHADPTLLLPCCYQHDKAYYIGGSAEDRQNADLELASCVQRRSGSETLASVFYYCIRIGGRPKSRPNYRWGKAWPYARGYKALSADEKALIDAKLSAFDCPSAIRDQFTQDPNTIDEICR